MRSTTACGWTQTWLGLGCSRLGSINGASLKEAEELLNRAIELGVTHFDTASVYGQGDSERVLGRVVGRNPKLLIATKIGKSIPAKARMVRPIKGVIRALTRRSSAAGTVVTQARAGTLQPTFKLEFLKKELDGCHRRLGLDHIPMVMLHSASSNAINEGAAVDVLDHAKSTGSIGLVGVSVDDLSAAEAALADDRIDAIQAPFLLGDEEMHKWGARAKAAGKMVIAREVFRSRTALDLPINEAIERGLKRASENAHIDLCLFGTTKISHLEQAMDIASKAHRDALIAP